MMYQQPGPSCSMSAPTTMSHTSHPISINSESHSKYGGPSSSSYTPNTGGCHTSPPSLCPPAMTTIGCGAPPPSLGGPAPTSQQSSGGLTSAVAPNLGALPNTPNGGLNGGATDDASSGYGSPDSMTLEER